MSKIFEGAKFGDAFKTKDGRKVIYHYYECWHYLITDDGGDICCGDDGSDTKNDCDNIVGRWVEPIDEKRLNDMAVQLADDYCKDKNCGHIMPNDWEIAHDCVLIGLKKVLELY